MSKTPTAQQIGEAVLLLASLFNGGAAVPSPSTTSTSASKTADKPAAETSTPDAPKADAAPPAGNSQNLSQEEFGKRMMAFAAACKDKGAKLKEIWAGFTSNDPANPKIERGAMVKTEDYDAVLALVDEHLAALALG